jgi:DNA-binding NarL/FixJ family response regulator
LRLIDAMKSVNVLIMDDAVVVRKLISALLSEIENVQMIFQAGDAVSAVQLFVEHKPQIAILDIKVPGGDGMKNGIDVLRMVKKASPNATVIMLTNHANARYSVECKQAGADFFFDKSTEFDRLPAAVAEVLRRDA